MTHTLVDGNFVKNCLQSGIDLNKARHVYVKNNHIYKCGLENGNSGIFIYGTKSTPAIDVKIVGNKVYYCGGNGIKVGQNAHNVVTKSNISNNNSKNGIFLQGNSKFWRVSYNKCQGNGFNGIHIFKTNGDVSDIDAPSTLDRNSCLQNYQNGFLLDTANNVNVTNNVAKDNSQEFRDTYDGFRFTNTTTLCAFSRNYSSGTNQRYALAMVDFENLDNAIRNNTWRAGVSGRVGHATNK